MAKSKRIHLFVLLLVGAVGAASHAHARVEITPSLSTGVTYTDNLNLAPEDGNKESSQVLTVSPGIDLSLESARSSVTLGFGVEYQKYSTELDDGSDSKSVQKGALNAEYSIVPEHLTANVAGDISQQSRGGVSDPSQISSQDTHDKVSTGSVGLLFNNNFGRSALLDIEVSSGVVEYEDPAAVDAVGMNLGVGLSSGPNFTQLAWDMRVAEEVEKLDTGDETRVRSATATLTRPLSQRFSAFGTIGYEEIETAQNISEDETDGAVWNVGVIWEPNTRFRARASYGDRPFGKTYEGSIDWTHKRRALQFTYTENIETATTFRLQAISGTAAVSPGPTSSVGSGSSFGVVQIQPVNELHIDRTAALNFTWQGRQTSFGINAHFTRNETIGTNVEQRDNGMSLSAERQLGRKTSAGIGYEWGRVDLLGLAGTRENIGILSVNVERAIGQQLTLSAQLSHTEKNVDSLLQNDYQVSQASLTLAGKF